MEITKAMLYEDYIKIRDAKIGEEVVLSDGTTVIRSSMKTERHRHRKPTKNMNLDCYDGTYVG